MNIPIFSNRIYGCRSLRGHAQLRNSATTGILAGERNQKYSFNQGIFLDIFPLDNIPDDKRQRENQAKKIRHYKNRACFWAKFTTRYSGTSKSVLKQNVKKMISGLFGNFMEKYQLEKRDYCRFEKACEEFDFDKTLLVSTLSLDESNEAFYKYKEDYIETIDMPFEFISIPVGKNMTMHFKKDMEIIWKL